jgi:hypothetical protein
VAEATYWATALNAESICCESYHQDCENELQSSDEEDPAGDGDGTASEA